MLILGIALAVVGAALLALGLFTTSDEGTGPAEMLGLDVGATSIFVLGVVAAVLVLVGLWCMKFGTKQTLKHRRESRELSKLSQKLERVEADRRKDDDPEQA